MRATEAPEVERTGAPVETSRAEPPRALPEGYPAGGRAFDWAIVLLSGWLIGGLHLDGWAHNHHPDLETFFTPWHAVLYSGFFALFLTLFFTFVRNAGRGYPRRRALPLGYNLSLVGGFIFLVGGVLDLTWHTLFGIEANTEALLSPTHLILATGIVLMVSGPLRAAWQHPAVGRGRAPFVALLPVLLSATFLLALFAFFTQFAHPHVDLPATQNPRATQVRDDLYVMARDGSAQTRLTIGTDQQSTNAAWSPDGSTFAFEVANGKSRQLFLMRADGTGRTQLTDSKGANDVPAWSPDGRRIAFTSTRNGLGEIFVMNADGSGQTRLTTRAKGNDFTPAWSPDGRKIAFHSNRDGNWAIYTMNADGTGETRLTPPTANSFFPSWSPDSARIAFASTRDGHDEIYLMNADGSGQARVTTGKANNWLPAWSPDGRTIAFFSNRGTRDDVFAMNPDGSDQTNLTRSLGADATGRLSWSPDGAKIAYTIQGRTGAGSWQSVNIGVASILLQAILFMTVILLLLRRWHLPFGSLTLIFAITSLLISFMHDHYGFIPAAILAGLFSDLLLQRLRPAPARANPFHLFAFAVPVIFYACYFAALALTDGIGWTVHLWAGAIVMSGIAGLLLSYLIVPRARDQTA